MSAMSVIIDEIKRLVTADLTLSGALTAGYLQIGAPLSFPSICIDGMVADNGKQEMYSFNINLFASGSNSGADKLAFYELADTLKAALTASPLILGGNWLDRSETKATGVTSINVLRAMFPCTAYLANAL